MSSLGVTGVRSKITTDIGAMVDLVREVTDVPVAVEFGISTPEQAKKMASQSDGAIVGSAIIKIILKKYPTICRSICKRNGERTQVNFHRKRALTRSNLEFYYISFHLLQVHYCLFY